jgi:hypothetical protein
MIRSVSWFSALWIASLLPFTAAGAEPETPDPKATVADLAWMTGYWTGPVGDLVMEENWNAPLGGTLASTVRMVAPNGTNMVELVIIREHEGSLQLALQQFRPDYTPVNPAAQKMRLVNAGEQTVTFEDTEGTTGLRRLTYSRTGDTFTVEALLPDGNIFRAALGSR